MNSAKSSKSSCFVIMPFGNLWDDYYAQIYVPAIEQAGLVAVRADEVFRAGSVLQDIVELLTQATIVLADVSDNNRNVHYELGLAHALGKPTILVAPIGVPLFFDVGQERMVTYQKDRPFWGADLLGRATRTIEETVRAPETAVPTAFMHIKPNRFETDEITVRLRRIEEQLGELMRSGGGGQQSRFTKILKGLPAAEARAEELLISLAPAEVVQRLMIEGYGEVMAESAVTTVAGRARRN